MTIPSPCPCCGAHSLAPNHQGTVLLAVCDVMVLKALDKLGNYIVRAERRRHNLLGSKPRHLAHTLWQPDDFMVAKALKSAWDVVPAVMDNFGCCDVTSEQVVPVLNQYVHDLAITGSEHDTEELRYRFKAHLGISYV